MASPKKPSMSLSFVSELDERLRTMSTQESRVLVRVVSRLVLKGLAYERVFGPEPINENDIEEQVTKELRALKQARRQEATK